MSSILEQLASLTQKINGIAGSVTGQIKKWDGEVQALIRKTQVVQGGVYHATTAKEAIALIRKANGREIVGGDYVVQLPAGTFDSDWVWNFEDVGSMYSNRIVLKGAGKGQTIIRNTGDDYVVRAANAIVRLDHLTIDGKNEKKRLLISDYASCVRLTGGTVELKNSKGDYAISIGNYSLVIGEDIEFNNLNGGIDCSLSRAYFPRLKFNGRTDRVDNTGAFATINRGGDLFIGGSVIDGKGLMRYGVIGANNSTVSDSHDVTIKNVYIPIYAYRGAIFYMYRPVFTGVKEATMTSYHGSWVYANSITSTLASGAKRHFYADSGEVYIDRGTLNNGEEVATCTYQANIKLYNIKGLNNIVRPDGKRNYVYLSGMSVLQDHGTAVDCNVAPNTTLSQYGTRY